MESGNGESTAVAVKDERADVATLGGGDVSTFLTREEILNADDAAYEIVPVEEWKKGGKVRVRNFTAAERDEWEKSMAKEVPVPGGKGKTRWITDASNIRAKAVARCCVKADGSRVFTDGDIVHLGRKSSAPIDRIFAVIQRLSGISQGDMEEMEGNSESDRSENSSGF